MTKTQEKALYAAWERSRDPNRDHFFVVAGKQALISDNFGGIFVSADFAGTQELLANPVLAEAAKKYIAPVPAKDVSEPALVADLWEMQEEPSKPPVDLRRLTVTRSDAEVYVNARFGPLLAVADRLCYHADWQAVIGYKNGEKIFVIMRVNPKGTKLSKKGANND